jgi:signal transduction histidine kinase
MRIRTKIIGLVAGVLAGACAACGTFAVNQYMNISVEKAAAAEMEKLALAERIFGGIGTGEELEQMGETARNAYLRYQFERCYQKGYVLMKDRECIMNLTDYEISAPEALKSSYVIQRQGDAYLLILKRDLPYPQGFWVMSVKDITSTWEEGRWQAENFLKVFFVVFGVSVGIAAAVMSHMLKALEKLRIQAERIREGDFGGKTKLTSRDELRELSESLNSMSDQIRQQIEDLKLLPGAMAHEMKTPLTNIMGYADSLLHVRLSERQREQSLEAIFRSAERLNRMSGKLLQLVGLYENREIENRTVDLEEVIGQAYEENRERLMEKDINFQIQRRGCPAFPGKREADGQEKEGMSVEGDPLLLFSLFDNLVSNSVKAVEEGGQIQVVLDRNLRRVCVRDNGRGIPPGDLPHVTKAFYMVDKSRSRRQQGSGLGLALAERIVRAHGGKLEIESYVGKGTNVTVTFEAENRKKDKRNVWEERQQ